MLHSFANINFSLLSHIWIWISLWAISAPPVFADLVRIDDNSGQVSYSPANNWHAQPGCGTLCSAQPDSPNDIYMGTWHDGSHWHGDPTFVITVPFTGTAVYVYGIKGHGDSFSATDLTFQIDGQTYGTYSQPDIQGTGWEYNFQFFKAEGLSPTTHTLTILNGANNNAAISNLLLDYIAYQSVPDKPSTTHTNGIAPTESRKDATTATATATATATVTNSASTHTSGTSTGTTSGTTSTDSSASFASTPGATSGGATATVTVDHASSTDSSNNSVGGEQTGDSSNHTGAIIGGVIGAIAFILIILVLLCLLMRRRRESYGNTGCDGPTPSTTETGTNPNPTLLSRLAGRNDSAPVEPFTATAPDPIPSAQESTSSTTPTSLSALTNPHLFANRQHILQQASGMYKPPLSETGTAATGTGTFITLTTNPNLTGYGNNKEPQAVSPQEAADTHSRAIDTAITLAEEVRRLREENDRLREAALPPTTEDEVPPPYLRNSSRISRVGSGMFSRFG